MKELTLAETNVYRNIIERSPMINNDEYIIYTKSLLDEKTITDMYKELGYTVVISRPVYEIEELTNFDKGPLAEEKVQPITRLIDMYHQIITELNVIRQIPNNKITPSMFLARIVGEEYYDCMTGGMYNEKIQLIKWLLMKNPDIDRTEKVYPKSNNKGWYTLSDFLISVIDVKIPEVINLLK